MENKFYTEFDLKRLTESKRTDDFRTPFQIDRDRIIYSSELRRLQGKTQVFLSGEYDFYRTRLTHTIEVAQIGRAICNYLKSEYKDLFADDFYIDPDLVEAVCLSHDLGHPPFGHAGERTLNKLMNPYGGFEGNAQTLRLLTETFYRAKNQRRGMNPTRSLLDGVLKYKMLFHQFVNPKNHFLYDYQANYLRFVFNGKEIPNNISAKLNSFRSVECQIMDWADDTAYAVNDIVDSIQAGFINIIKLNNWGQENAGRIKSTQIEYLEQTMEWIKDGTYKREFGSQIGQFIRACKISRRETFADALTNRYKYNIELDEDIMLRAQFYKQLSYDMVFNSPQLHQMEFKADHIIKKLFEVLVNNYLGNNGNDKLIPEFSNDVIILEENDVTKIRLICDFISGMTDRYAVRTYRRLFDPDFGSLADLI
ncbi:MAG: dNTP triphosphohydrolase [Melioribacteraceae bacterium]|nr:dNTP triphosphohydrolase [Melioribacteraceae bacterium]MCF8263568.1 dNTP triphosphohydrolase [Melioribacteraceae bacterium]MCF8431237.1 dNTP triphosphohydrolase [Melioribacteraceae bacterium]